MRWRRVSPPDIPNSSRSPSTASRSSRPSIRDSLFTSHQENRIMANLQRGLLTTGYHGSLASPHRRNRAPPDCPSTSLEPSACGDRPVEEWHHPSVSGSSLLLPSDPRSYTALQWSSGAPWSFRSLFGSQRRKRLRRVARRQSAIDIQTRQA